MKKSTWWYAGGGVAAGVLALAWAFAPRPLEVEAAVVVQGPFEASIEEDARTRLRERYVVSAPLAGRLDRITLREGDAVAAGAALATLTPVMSPLLDERTLRELRARVQGAQANVERAAARVERAKVAVLQARNEAFRSEELASRGFVSPNKLETDRLAAAAAQRELDAAAAERHVAGYDVEQARAALGAVSQGGPSGRAFVLHSPIAGRVLRVAQTSEASVALGTPLLELGDTARMEVVAELLTTEALRLHAGDPVNIERWGGDGALQGRVRLVEPAAFTKVSALGVEEQRVKVLIDITSSPELWRALGDGYRVGVRITVLAVEKAVQVPLAAVFPLPGAEGGGMAVFALDGQRARLAPVEVGARNASHAWVRSGIAPGAQVIVYPPAATSDGARVKVRKV